MTQRRPAPVNLTDYEALAFERLDERSWAYFSGGAADEITLRENRAAWDALRLRPRVLASLAGGHTRTQLLGRKVPHPILLAPVAYQRLAHEQGELGAAAAAAAQQAGLVLSCQASVPMEHVAQIMCSEPAEQRGPLWFQLVVQADRGATRDLALRAQDAGYEALVLTVDAPTHGARDRERRANFQLPPGVCAVNLQGSLAGPGTGRPGALLGGHAEQAATWDDVRWLREQCGLPLLLKGVLHPDDARQAQALGVDGLIVSNHGGRTLDTTLATAHALPGIAQAVGPSMTLLVDGGIRRGTDVLKAIALGAHGVLLGRPQVMALAAAGPQGVAHVIRLLRDELEIAMALAGCATLNQVGPGLLA